MALQGQLEVPAHFAQMETSPAGRYQQITLLVTLMPIDSGPRILSPFDLSADII